MSTPVTRKQARDFALQVYSEAKHNRSYALTPDAEAVLAALAFAMSQYRRESGDFKDDELLAERPFTWLINKLSEIGTNVLQTRPTDAPALPKCWTHPITGEALKPPQGPDERAILQRLDPQLLKWFDQMEQAPYRTVAAYRESEAQRKALGVVPYTEAEHKLNPYLGKNETAKANLAKRDSELAKFYERESKPVELRLFGANQDLTVRGRLDRDSYTNSIVKVAEQIHERWRNEDRAQAQREREQAEATLKRLESTT